MLKSMGIQEDHAGDIAKVFKAFDAQKYIDDAVWDSLPSDPTHESDGDYDDGSARERRRVERARRKLTEERRKLELEKLATERLKLEEEKEREERRKRESSSLFTFGYSPGCVLVDQVGLSLGALSLGCDPVVGVNRSNGSANGDMIYEGPRGGRYRINSNGNKTYI